MKITRRLLAILFVLSAPLFFVSRAQTPEKPAVKGQYIAYVGTYTSKTTSKGIYAYRFDAEKGQLTPIGIAAETADPSFLAVHPNGKFLYESNRRTKSEEERAPDTIGVYSVDPQTGMLTPVEQSLTGGVMPRFFTIDPTGAYLLAANQISNNVVLYKIDPSTGRLLKTNTEINVDTPVCLKFVPMNH